MGNSTYSPATRSRRRPPTPMATRVCAHCGEDFQYPNYRGKAKKYCSPPCRSLAQKAMHANQLRPECSVEACGKRAKSLQPGAMCEMHYYRMRRNGSATTKVRSATGRCHHCGEPTARKSRGIFCSQICATRDRIGAAPGSRACAVCASELYHEQRLGSIYCSDSCQHEAAKWRKYGLSIRAGRALLAQQDGKCAICRADVALVVDHCHVSGAVRGLLCGTCNAGIGMLKDDPYVLSAAIDYLTRSSLTIVA